MGKKVTREKGSLIQKEERIAPPFKAWRCLTAFLMLEGNWHLLDA